MDGPLHKVSENCHFLDHPPIPLTLRNIKISLTSLEHIDFWPRELQFRTPQKSKIHNPTDIIRVCTSILPIPLLVYY